MLDILKGLIFLVLAVGTYFNWRRSADKDYLRLAIICSAFVLVKIWDFVNHNVFRLPVSVELMANIAVVVLGVLLATLLLKILFTELKKLQGKQRETPK